jgi:hypothetical protein
VKGTRGLGTSIILTDAEVENARRAEGYRVDLYVLSEITVGADEGILVAAGGTARLVENWLPEQDRLRPMQYRYRIS